MKTIRRRRREAKTDYKSRFALLKSQKPRLVVRKTNRYILAQLVTSEVAQDKILVRASSKELLDKGWPKEKAGSLKSLHAAYLTGFLLANKLKDKPSEVLLDTGLYQNVKGSRVYAVLKGALDGGLKIPSKSDSLPSEERFKSNANLFKFLEEVKEKL